ncbi:MAG: hypothetical protein EOM35_06565 [Negativicutes bacterium]|nr:hypothetical protein [Negativicutes bacterium]
MNKQKLENYNLTGSIHTLAVRSPGIIEDIQEEVSPCIIASSQTKNGTTTTSIINVNKLMGDVFAYSEFETVFDTILAGAGIGEYNIVRADMRFDSYDKEHYRQYAKLNRYLISALAVTYKVKNAYRSTNLFTQKQLSIAIKNKYFECENYDKEAESEGADAAASRLEERSKSWNDKDLKREFTEHWFDRWDKAIENLATVQKTYNDALEQLYKSDRHAYPCRFRSLTDFLIQYQDCIFCKAQMVDLLSRFEEVKNPVTRAENHKKRYGIEYFSKKDVQQAIGEVKRATTEFFES